MINTNSICPLKRSRFVQTVFLLLLSMFSARTVTSEIVELSITGNWSATDMKVTKKIDKSFNLLDPKFDGKVFGLEPSSGNVTIRITVDTEGVLFFPKGSQIGANGTNPDSLTYDHYGYTKVRLVDEVFIFGTATWKSEGILAGLEGPGRIKAAIWTDTDLMSSDPTRVHFRMFGKANGLSADLFVSGSTNGAFGGQFLLWEYYKGEEIRSNKYTVSRKIK